MFAKRMRLVAGSIAVITALVVALGSVVAFDREPNVVDPESITFEEVQNGTEIAIPPPRMVNPDLDTYPEVVGNLEVSAPDGRPVAQLASPPASFNGSLGAHFTELKEVPVDAMAFTILASVQYSGEHNVVITTARQSGPEDRSIILGNETVMLEDGSKAWASNKANAFPDAPNEVVFVRDGLIITLASDLLTDELVKLASDVIIAGQE